MKNVSILEKPFYPVAEVCDRWNMGVHDIAAFVLAGELTLSATVAGLCVIHGAIVQIDADQWERIPGGRRTIIGTIDLMRDDAWMVMQEGSHEITHLKAPEDEYLAVDDYLSNGHYLVTQGALVICKAEIDRFEAAHPGLAAIVRKNVCNRRLAIDDRVDAAVNLHRPGAPQKYDWDAFWVELCRRIYEEGVPRTQGELVGLMLDWFGQTGRHVPDGSTVKKKVSPLWRQIAPRAVGASNEFQERRA